MINILNIDLIKNVLIIGMGSSIVVTALVQKIKSFLNKSTHIPLLCFAISIIIGTLFALAFSDITLIYALWAGLFAFVGADALYQAFEDKIFKSFTSLNETVTIDRGDDDGL